MITGSLLEEDFLDSQYFHRSRYVKRTLLVLGALAIVGSIMWLAFDHSFIGLIMVCGAVGGFLGEFIVRTLILPRRLRRVYRQHAGYKSNFTYSWDQDALTADSDIGHARRPWSHYTKWLENDHVFLLYHSDVMFELIPKRWFSSRDQLANFRNAVSRIGA